MIFEQQKIDNIWTPLSHTLIIFLFSLPFTLFLFSIFFAKEEEEK
jgi:hypothetical protein